MARVTDLSTICDTDGCPIISRGSGARLFTAEFFRHGIKVVAAGRGRTAAEVRNYLRAAYALAIRAETNPAAPQSLRDFGIQVNPVASIDALAQYNRACKRNLSAPELTAFLKRVAAEPIDLSTLPISLSVE